MVDKSCHNHSGLLLYVALKWVEKTLPRFDNAAGTLEFYIQPPHCLNETMKRRQGDPPFRIRFVAWNIVFFLLLQKPSAQKEIQSKRQRGTRKTQKKISKEINITNKEEITAVH